MLALANGAKILSRITAEPFVGVLTERILCAVDTDTGRQEPNDSPRGESIFVTWSPKIYHEARLHIGVFQASCRLKL